MNDIIFVIIHNVPETTIDKAPIGIVVLLKSQLLLPFMFVNLKSEIFPKTNVDNSLIQVCLCEGWRNVVSCDNLDQTFGKIFQFVKIVHKIVIVRFRVNPDDLVENDT